MGYFYPYIDPYNTPTIPLQYPYKLISWACRACRGDVGQM